MSEVSRRDFMKGAVTGAAVLAAAGSIQASAAEGEENTILSFPGKPKFAGISSIREVTEDIYYVGCSDRRIELFENVYPIPRGVAYNSYVLLDEKTVLFDTVDRSVTGQFFENLKAVLDGRTLDYLVVNHMEPDHSSAITEVLTRYPNAKLVCTVLASLIMYQFFGADLTDRMLIVGEGDTLSTGRHELVFVMAPMVHWPEVMMTFDTTSGTLFSADAFGSFGALGGNLFADEVNFEQEWLPDARRYYCNIVGKYGDNVQAVLAKAATVPIQRFCATHGPVWRENLGWLLDKYDKWSRYEPEEKAVMIVYGSIYGGTESAAHRIADRLSKAGIRNVAVYDVSKTHVSELIAEAFRCSHLVFASITYNMGIFTPMKNFIQDLAAHNLQKRHYSLVQNGSWSAASGPLMKELLDQMKGMTQVGDIVTFMSSPGVYVEKELEQLADEIAASVLSDEEPEPVEEPAAGTKWKCGVCGYVYEGEEMPEDYKCPICGVGPSMFEKVAE